MEKHTVIHGEAEAAGQAQTIPVPKYVNPAGNEYPVIAYNNYLFPDKLATTEDEIDDVIQSIKSCGFNANIWICEGLDGEWRNLIATYYKVAAANGLRTIYNMILQVPKVIRKDTASDQQNGVEYDPALARLAELLNLNKGNANLWGYYLGDEPKYNEWAFNTPAAPVDTRDFPAMFQTYLKNANGHVGFFNLAVATTEKFIGATLAKDEKLKESVKYARYLKEFKDKFNPSMMTVDIYPLFKYVCDGQLRNCYDLGDCYVQKNYYCMLETIGDFSTRYSIPFWMFMLSTKYTSYLSGSKNINTERPYPSEGVLRYQAMNALAFGFQGLVFWTYGLKESSYQDIPDPDDPKKKLFNEEYTDAPYDAGYTTDVWGNCYTVIKEIRYYGDILLGCKFIQAKHVYGPLISETFEETKTFNTYMGCLADATSEGRGFVVTQLNKDSGDKYMMIVSHDPYNEQNITIRISAGIKWEEVVFLDDSSGYLDVHSGTTGNKEQTVTGRLEPGGLILIHYANM